MSCKMLKKKLSRTPYLMITPDGEVSLATDAEALQEMNERGSALLVNLQRALANFGRLDGAENQMFDRVQIGQIAGVDPVYAWNWLRDGILVPSMPSKGPGPGNGARYSWDEAFCAGVIGVLRRHRVHPEILSKIQPLLT